MTCMVYVRRKEEISEKTTTINMLKMFLNYYNVSNTIEICYSICLMLPAIEI